MPDPPASPTATRAPRRSWRDPRLLVGVLVVATSVLVGARVLATADDMTSVWALSTHVRAGATLSESDLERQRVRFSSSAQAAAYVAGDAPAPTGAAVDRALDAGELLPRSALADGVVTELVEVPLAVPADAVVASLSAGETVDVWVTPSSVSGGDGDRRPAERVLAGVRVVAVPESATALGPASTRQVVVGLPVSEEEQLAGALASLAAGSAVIVRRS